LGPTCQSPFSPLPFFFPLLAGHRHSRAESAASPPSPLPFSPQRARQLRQLIPHSNPRPFPFFPLPSLRPDDPPAINGKPPAAPSPSASPSSLRPYLSSHSIACASLCPPNTPTHLLELNSLAPPPRVPAAAVQAPPSVKDHLRRLPSLLFGFTRGLTSACCCRFTSLTPPGAPSPSAGALPGSPSTRARSFASLSTSTVAARSTRRGEH
jgi:hypothetical protein